MRKKTWQNFLSMILVLALLVSSIPMPVYALAGEALVSGPKPYTTDMPNPYDVITDDSTLENIITNEFFTEAYIVEEDEGKRGEFNKEYILSNGIRLATIYPSSIHYEDNGEWKEIDNTLIAMISDGNTFYTNTAGKLNVRFPQNLTASDMIGITKGEFSIQFGMVGELRSAGDLVVASVDQIGSESAVGALTVSAAQTSTAQIQQIDLTAARAEAEHPETVLDKLNSRLIYANVYPNTNVVYDLQGNRLKESIILQQYDSTLWGYRYTLDTGDLVPVLNEDQHIDLCDPDTNEVVLTMPAPYLMDDNGAFNYDVEVSLVHNGSCYLLSYYLPKEWLEEADRAWPVILDPVITEPGIYTNVQDRTVTENYAEANTHGTIQCGYYSNAGAMRFFMQFIELPGMTSADVIIDATISLYKPYASGTTANVEVHQVTETWNSANITWNTQPAFNANVEDYVVCKPAGRYEWNITDIVRGWYENANNGMMFKVPSDIETAGTDNWKQFYSSDYNSGLATMPILTITYHNNNGLESYWDYTSTSAGRAGTGYVQNYSGNLVWVHSDIGFDGNRMPVSISHIYSTDDAWDTETNAGNNKFGMGNGWRTNFNQTITAAMEDDGTVYYIWEDGDGTAHDFFANTSGVYKDIDDLGLTLIVTTAGYTITDKYDNTSNFDSRGRLINQINNQATKSNIDISYQSTTSNLITQILDGVNRKYTFTYSNGLLSQITYYGTGSTSLSKVQFEYSNSNLTSITYADGKKSNFTYTAKNLLSAATDIDGYQIALSYNTLESNKSSRVVSITESDNGKVGASTTLEYYYHYTKLTDHDGNTQTIFFNEWGNTISVQDSEGNALFYQYATDVNENGIKNRILATSQEQNTTVNLIADSSFEGRTAWNAGSASTSCTSSSTHSYLGSWSLKSTCNVDGEEIGATTGTYNVSPGATYTFSAYVKTDANSEVKLRITDNLGTFVNSELLKGDSDWTRLEVTYTNTSSVVRRITLSLYHSSAGTAYIDCVQLEKNKTASRYNILEDGDFDKGIDTSTSAWSSYSNSVAPTISSGATAPTLSNNRLCIIGDVNAIQHVYQIINISGKKDDSYVLAGWTMGDALPDNAKNCIYGLALTIFYTDGTSDEVKVFANPNLGSEGQWQYLSVPLIAKKSYSSIMVRIEYFYNANTVYFDGLQLYQGDFGQTYSYDANGNVTEVRDVLGQKTQYKYNDSNDVIESIAPSGVKTTYSVDDFHNVTNSMERYTDADGTVINLANYTYRYDSYGNQIEHRATVDHVVKSSFAGYSSDGNHLAATADELGNITTYSYNLNTSVLEWIRYPKDTEATQTKYCYDTMYRLIRSSTTTDQGKEMSAQYSYVDDVLTKITTKTTTYSFAYGDFALRTSVSIGSRALATYTYSDNENKYLEELAYGNGDVVKYTYDDLGRVIEELFYENGSTIISRTISYQYDNTGALATMTDSKTGVTTKYYYDTVGRITGQYESGGSAPHSLRYTYDALGRVVTAKETYGSSTYSTDYVYNGKGLLHSITSGSTSEIYTYDAYDRLDKWYTFHEDSSVYLILKNIHYKEPDERSTSSWPTVWSYTSTGEYSINYNYGYDANGNIVSAAADGYTTTYQYDSANQLIRENNQAAGKTWVWTYDGAGNITSKKEYAYTTGTLGSVITTITYGYSDSAWGDLLTHYRGQPLTYDTTGNLIYDGTWSYSWSQGRQLTTMYYQGSSWNFTYDAGGMRTRRTNGANTYTYVYNGSQLSLMTYNGTTLHFTYDASGKPLSVTYEGATYYYVLNLQGDVVAILNSSGVAVVEYTYDAWGKPLTTTGSMASSLGQINPLRYRSYVYDRETGLYYLQSRYYNPTWGRFISCDKYASTGQGLIGYNMFTYCNNNPINNIDYTGDLAISLSLLIIGTLMGSVIAAGIDTGMQLAENGGDISSLDIGSIINSALIGGALGFSTAMGVGYLGPVIAGTATFGAGTLATAFGISVGVSALAGGGGYLLEETINGNEVSTKNMLLHSGTVALQSAVNFGVGGMIGSTGNIGTKGSFLSREWWSKLIVTQEFSMPFRYLTNLLVEVFCDE